jgi:tripartite ATP-independent transporter DctP family solute receptor
MERTHTILAGLLFCLCALPAEARGFRKEYRMQVTVGPTTYWGMGAARFAKLAREKTAGRVRVKPYYGSQLLKGAQLNSSQMVAMGGIDLAFESTINTAPVIPEMNIFSLPFFVDTFANLDKLENGETGRLLFEAMERKGLVPLAWGENGFRQLTNSKRPVVEPGDLRGLRVRVVGSPVFVDIFRALGADPINMNWGDAVTAFQQGTVDGQENPVGILLPVQIHQYHKYVTMWNYLVDPLILYWNKRQWDAFPPDIRQALREAAHEAVRFEKALVRAGLDGEESLGVLREEFGFTPAVTNPPAHLRRNGMTVTSLSDEQKAAFRAATRPVMEKWMSKLGGRILEAARNDLSH